MAKIDYPDFQKLKDPQLIQQFKLVWDLLASLDSRVDAIPVPDPSIAALQETVKTLGQKTNSSISALASAPRDHNSLTGLQGGSATERYHLTVDERVVALHSSWPAVHVSRSTNQTINSSAWTAISFDTANKNPRSMWAAGAPTKIVFGTAGFYLFGGEVHTAANATGQRAVVIDLNNFGNNPVDSTMLTEADPIATSGGGNVGRVVVVGTGQFLATDYIELKIFQDSGVGLAVTAVLRSPRFWAFRVCD